MFGDENFIWRFISTNSRLQVCRWLALRQVHDDNDDDDRDRDDTDADNGNDDENLYEVGDEAEVFTDCLVLGLQPN